MKNRFIVPLLAFVLLAGVLAYGVKRSPEKHFIASVMVGKPVPEFTLPSLTDPAKTVTSKSLHGKPYIINVWGTWCPACRDEHQSLLEIQQLGQVPLIGVDWRDTDEDALNYLARLGNPYTHVAVDKQGRLAIDLGVYGAPETFLIDAKGIIIHKHIGPLSVEAFKRDFEPKLSGQKPEGAT
jgi:cytochrome c biogenesis protein CcmG/thiol:disulfide interchange protein DsbE